jgi:hypothetical protein
MQIYRYMVWEECLEITIFFGNISGILLEIIRYQIHEKSL